MKAVSFIILLFSINGFCGSSAFSIYETPVCPIPPKTMSTFDFKVMSSSIAYFDYTDKNKRKWSVYIQSGENPFNRDTIKIIINSNYSQRMPRAEGSGWVCNYSGFYSGTKFYANTAR